MVGSKSSVIYLTLSCVLLLLQFQIQTSCSPAGYFLCSLTVAFLRFSHCLTGPLLSRRPLAPLLEYTVGGVIVWTNNVLHISCKLSVLPLIRNFSFVIYYRLCIIISIHKWKRDQKMNDWQSERAKEILYKVVRECPIKCQTLGISIVK